MLETTAYEERLFGREKPANDDARTRRPNVIDQAIDVFGGKENYRYSWRGHEFKRNERWHGPYNMYEFIREANLVLKAEGKPQISANPAWVITEATVCI
jgi:hypothetical protein